MFEHFNFAASIDLLEDADLLYKVVRNFANVDLSPETVDNYHMGLVFEELIRKFAESSNETAGEHFTPATSCGSPPPWYSPPMTVP